MIINKSVCYIQLLFYQTPKEAQTLDAPIQEDPEVMKKNLEETLAQPVSVFLTFVILN